MEENRRTRRRWFRFSLRTLFLVVTVVCIWLGYSMNWIRERQALLDKVNAVPPHRLKVIPAPSTVAWVLHDDATPPPLQLKILGERGVRNLWLGTASDADVARALVLFPEAKVVVRARAGGEEEVVRGDRWHR